MRRVKMLWRVFEPAENYRIKEGDAAVWSTDRHTKKAGEAL